MLLLIATSFLFYEMQFPVTLSINKPQLQRVERYQSRTLSERTQQEHAIIRESFLQLCIGKSTAFETLSRDTKLVVTCEEVTTVMPISAASW